MTCLYLYNNVATFSKQCTIFVTNTGAVQRRKIRLIEAIAKCRHLKKMIGSGPEPHTPPPPLHTVYVYTVYYSHTEGESLISEKGRGATVHKAGPKYQYDCLYLQSLNSDKHLPRSPFTGQFF